jgi:chemotaxis response regulator CheB
MPSRDIVVIGASAGGVAATGALLRSLPQAFDGVVFVALHRHPEQAWDRLGDLLAYDSPLTARAAIDGQRFTHGELYVAPSNVHLLVERGVIRLESSPKESRARPSVDALFRSAAMAYGRRVIGIVLSGMLSDGTVGLWQVRKYGGIAIAQDPDEALHADMPRSAIDNVPVHYCLPIAAIALKVAELASSHPPPSSSAGSRARLLIVEDERIVALALANRLVAAGYTVVGSVSTGEEAIATAATTMPDLVLMDISLAGSMRGTEAAAILWRQYQLPVVYLTAYSDQRTLDEAKLSMPFGYVVKPYRIEQIRTAIDLALDRYEREMDVRSEVPFA